MTKYTNSWELWVGYDLVDDHMDWNTARLLAEQYRKEEPPETDVVLDEIRHYQIVTLEDIENVRQGKVEEE